MSAKTAEIFDMNSAAWVSTPPLAHEHWGATLTMLLDGRVLLAGGGPLATFGFAEIFDPVLNTWTDIVPMSTPPILGESSGDVLVLGWGSTRGAITSAVEELRSKGRKVSAILDGRSYIPDVPGSDVAALFLDPAARGRGGGRRLVEHAQALRDGELTVDVNEQNPAACGFYEALGFVVVGRSPVDADGRPFPLLHMRRPAPV